MCYIYSRPRFDKVFVYFWQSKNRRNDDTLDNGGHIDYFPLTISLLWRKHNQSKDWCILKACSVAWGIAICVWMALDVSQLTSQVSLFVTDQWFTSRCALCNITYLRHDLRFCAISWITYYKKCAKVAQSVIPKWTSTVYIFFWKCHNWNKDWHIQSTSLLCFFLHLNNLQVHFEWHLTCLNWHKSSQISQSATETWHQIAFMHKNNISIRYDPIFPTGDKLDNRAAATHMLNVVRRKTWHLSSASRARVSVLSGGGNRCRNLTLLLVPSIALLLLSSGSDSYNSIKL